MLAEEYDACCAQEKRLKGNIYRTKEYHKMKDTNQKTKLEKSIGWGIFAIVEIIFMVLINRGLSHILTLIANNGVTWEEYVASGRLHYQKIDVIMPVGAVLALPVAFLALFLVKKFLKHMDDTVNRKNLQENKNNKEENKIIAESNRKIMEHNYEIAEQLELLQQEKQDIQERLRKVNASFPMEYLTVPIIDYLEQELRTGKAKNLRQAIVHYEAGGV